MIPNGAWDAAGAENGQAAASKPIITRTERSIDRAPGGCSMGRANPIIVRAVHARAQSHLGAEFAGVSGGSGGVLRPLVSARARGRGAVAVVGPVEWADRADLVADAPRPAVPPDRPAPGRLHYRLRAGLRVVRTSIGGRAGSSKSNSSPAAAFPQRTCP